MSMTRSCFCLAASLLSSLTASLSAESPAKAVPLPAELAGCWELVDGERRVTEVWFTPSANRMLGISDTRVEGTSVAWELLRIEREGDSLVLRALPSGQDPAEFLLLSASGGEYVFENLQHDFPQRVVYPVPVGTELRARIEGPSATGENRVIPFTYQRIECDSLWSEAAAVHPPD